MHRAEHGNVAQNTGFNDRAEIHITNASYVLKSLAPGKFVVRENGLMKLGDGGPRSMQMTLVGGYYGI